MADLMRVHHRVTVAGLVGGGVLVESQRATLIVKLGAA
jgi:hypothetical protein